MARLLGERTLLSLPCPLLKVMLRRDRALRENDQAQLGPSSRPAAAPHHALPFSFASARAEPRCCSGLSRNGEIRCVSHPLKERRTLTYRKQL